MIKPDQFGKDHWSLLAYFDSLAIDNQPIDERRMRCNPERHPQHLVNLTSAPWKPEWSTRLKGYFRPDGTKDEQYLVDGHDDWDCKEDFVAAGYLYDTLDLAATFTSKGRGIMNQLREHKQKGGYFSGFDPFPAPEPTAKQATILKELREEGAIKKGQRWRKKGDKRIMTIHHRDKDNSWKVVFDSHSRRATHKLKERDIYRYYERV